MASCPQLCWMAQLAVAARSRFWEAGGFRVWLFVFGGCLCRVNCLGFRVLEAMKHFHVKANVSQGIFKDVRTGCFAWAWGLGSTLVGLLQARFGVGASPYGRPRKT